MEVCRKGRGRSLQGEVGLGGGNGPQIEAANEEEEAQGLPGKSVLSGAEPLTAEEEGSKAVALRAVWARSECSGPWPCLRSGREAGRRLPRGSPGHPPAENQPTEITDRKSGCYINTVAQVLGTPEA